jgi:hypothetical protein
MDGRAKIERQVVGGWLDMFGYDVPAEKMEEAKKHLLTTDRRAKAILAEIQQSGLEKVESDRMLVANAYQIAVLLKLMGDEEFLRAVRTFTTSFSRKTESKAGAKK